MSALIAGIGLMTLKLYRIGCHLTGPSSVDALGKAVVPWQKRTSGSIMSY